MRTKALSALTLAVLVVGAAFTLFPLFMAVLNSVKTEREMLNDILSFPAAPQWENYVRAFVKTDFLRAFFNTAVAAVIGLTGIVVFASMAGYKLSRVKSRLSSFLFGLFVLSMLVPFHSIMITLTRTAHDLHLQGTPAGLGLIYIGLGVSMAVFLYHGFVKSIPRELDEAAAVEGCGETRLFFAILFPLLGPITATIIILNLLWIWNDFLLPFLILTDSDGYTILLSINMLFGQYNNNEWSSILAALVLAMVPVLLLFLVLQKSILRGIADGAIKG